MGGATQAWFLPAHRAAAYKQLRACEKVSKALVQALLTLCKSEMSSRTVSGPGERHIPRKFHFAGNAQNIATLREEKVKQGQLQKMVISLKYVILIIC